MIYTDEFIKLLENIFGSDKIKVTRNNIICPCLWCERDEIKDHYHLYIGLDSPVFHCFYSGCDESGRIEKLFRKLGINSSDFDKYINRDLLSDKENHNNNNNVNRRIIKIPKIDRNVIIRHYDKFEYLMERLNWFYRSDGEDISDSDIMKRILKSSKNLFFSINDFLEINNFDRSDLLINFSNFDILESFYLFFMSNFNSKIICRSINKISNGNKHIIIPIYCSESQSDYYMIGNSNCRYKTPILIMCEGIFDALAINGSILYRNMFSSLIEDDFVIISVLSSNNYRRCFRYFSFYNSFYRYKKVIIFSDSDVNVNLYKKSFDDFMEIIDNFIVVYNKSGKDFANFPINSFSSIILKNS